MAPCEPLLIQVDFLWIWLLLQRTCAVCGVLPSVSGAAVQGLEFQHGRGCGQSSPHKLGMVSNRGQPHLTSASHSSAHSPDRWYYNPWRCPVTYTGKSSFRLPVMLTIIKRNGAAALYAQTLASETVSRITDLQRSLRTANPAFTEAKLLVIA